MNPDIRIIPESELELAPCDICGSVNVLNSPKSCPDCARFRAMLCTCECEDTGNGESGPFLSVYYDEACLVHGIKAQPEQWKGL
jgi:hypothetical protein